MPKYVLKSESEDLFKDMSDDQTASALEEETATPQPEEPAKEPEVEEKAAPVEEATVKKEPPPAPAPEEAPLPIETKAPSYEEVKAALDKQRADTMAQLMEAYSISSEDAETLSVEPQKVLPKLAAQIFYDTYTALWATVVSQFPSLASQYQQVVSTYSKYENQFFERWPQLSKHRATAEQAVRAYRQANPQASPQEVIEKGGLLAMFSSGLLPQEAPTDTKPAERPHTPIQPGGVGAEPKGGTKNIFVEMAEEELRENFA